MCPYEERKRKMSSKMEEAKAKAEELSRLEAQLGEHRKKTVGKRPSKG